MFVFDHESQMFVFDIRTESQLCLCLPLIARTESQLCLCLTLELSRSYVCV